MELGCLWQSGRLQQGAIGLESLSKMEMCLS